MNWGVFFLLFLLLGAIMKLKSRLGPLRAGYSHQKKPSVLFVLPHGAGGGALESIGAFVGGDFAYRTTTFAPRSRVVYEDYCVVLGKNVRLYPKQAKEALGKVRGDGLYSNTLGALAGSAYGDLDTVQLGKKTLLVPDDSFLAMKRATANKLFANLSSLSAPDVVVACTVKNIPVLLLDTPVGSSSGVLPTYGPEDFNAARVTYELAAVK